MLKRQAWGNNTLQLKEKYKGLSELLEGIPDSEIDNIEIMKFNKGDIIIERDRRDNRIFIILEGVCNVTKNFDTGISVTYYRVTNDDIIGFSELAKENSKRVACVEAQTNVVTAAVEREVFLRWFSQYLGFSMKVSSRIVERLHQTIQMFAECNNYPLYLSIITYLLYAYNFYQRQYNDVLVKDNIKVVKINESRREMAELLGVDVRSINRVIKQLKKDELITVIKGKIHIDRCQHKKLINIKYYETK